MTTSYEHNKRIKGIIISAQVSQDADGTWRSDFWGISPSGVSRHDIDDRYRTQLGATRRLEKVVAFALDLWEDDLKYLEAKGATEAEIEAKVQRTLDWLRREGLIPAEGSKS